MRTTIRILACLVIAITCLGCRITGSGSQAIDFNPFDWGSSTPALSVADGAGYDNGTSMNQRE